MLKIDAHIHVSGDHPDCVALLDQLDVKMLNVCVASSSQKDWHAERAIYRQLAAQHPRRYAWCTTLDVPDFSPDYVERTIAELVQDFAAGSVACKFWKNIGMDVRKPSGEFLMIDDPLFDPIYEYLVRVGKPALMHIAEPLACWQPLREDDPHYGYYSQHPEWHMYAKPEYPSHGEIIAARDHMLAKHPKLRVIGAHLGSLEWDVRELAKRLQAYPNFAVDTSARVRDLAHQDAATVREFFAAYPDRILFGTDVVIRDSFADLSSADRRMRLQRIQDTYANEMAYYEQAGQVTLRGRAYQGLGLAEEALRQLYLDNALAWYPGIA